MDIQFTTRSQEALQAAVRSAAAGATRTSSRCTSSVPCSPSPTASPWPCCRASASTCRPWPSPWNARSPRCRPPPGPRSPRRTCRSPPTGCSRLPGPRRGAGRRVRLHRAPARRPGRPAAAPTGALLAGVRCHPGRAARRADSARGGRRVTTPDPEAQFPGAREVRRRPHRARPRGQDRPGDRPRRRDPPGHPGADAGARRTTPCSSASPASARPPSSRAWPSGSWPATSPSRCKGKRLIGLDLGGDGRRGQVPRRVRGAAQGRAGGDQGLRRPGHHLHRRAAHRRRRRRDRRVGHGRRQHAQADAGPRRAAHGRGDHAGRVPRAHREGPGAGAALPAGARRRAQRRGHRSAILRGLKEKYEAHHKVAIADAALVAAATLSDRYITAPLPARQGHRPRRRGRLAGCAWRSTPPRSRSTQLQRAGRPHCAWRSWRWPRRPTRLSVARLAKLRADLADKRGAARRPAGTLGAGEGRPGPGRRPEDPHRRAAHGRRPRPARRRLRAGVAHPLRPRSRSWRRQLADA